jgi:hypothetical protein
MALNVPDVGENLILDMIVNKVAAQNLELRLYKNNITPSDTDTAGTFTESTFPGYAAISIPGTSWNSASGGSITYSAQQTFTCSGAAAESVYGYYVVQGTSGILMWAERDASAPFAIAVSGDAVKLTPAITAN